MSEEKTVTLSFTLSELAKHLALVGRDMHQQKQVLDPLPDCRGEVVGYSLRYEGVGEPYLVLTFK